MAPDNLHHRILDNLKTAIILVEPNLTVSYLNPAAEALLAVSRLRMTGHSVTKLFFEPEDAMINLLDAINNFNAYTKREAQLSLQTGEKITVDFAVTPVYETSGRKSLIIELQPLDRLLRISREEGLFSSQEHARVLIRGLAHEIKNPLGGLRGAAQLLARELPDDSLNDYTNIIIEEADRLRNQVDNMLGPNQSLNMEPTNIHEVLERVRHLVEAEGCGSVHIVRDYDPSIPELIADREQLIQATLNIVRNAVQALQQQNVSIEDPRIILRTRTMRQFTIGSHRYKLVCRVDVIDNGPGIADSVREAIFLPMVSGRPEGTGLGLSISQSIINRHRGLIECSSEPGNTVFTLNIPLELAA